ncbi:MAG: AMP-binding protein [Rhodocyclaceae bacterium]|jgi:acyl-CoA synthetase (AMP-forming)/AMP-acid ligase II|nr:AMP-binding protein [Rhodocyclaceae bacterium]
MNLVMALEMAAECHPQRIAVSSGGLHLSYADLQNAARVGAAIIRDAGVRYVGVLDVNSPAVPIALFAAAYAGVPYVPMNYRLTKPELEALLERITPALLIADEPVVAPLELPAGVKLMMRGEFQRVALSSAPEQVTAPGEPHDAAIQLFTSGTTGKPKAAILRHRNLMSYILGTVDFASADEKDAILVTVVREWLAEQQDRIEVFHLPPYSPELNPSEYFNGDLKGEIQRGIPPKDITDLRRTVLGHSLRIQKSPARVRGYFRNRRIRYAA